MSTRVSRGRRNTTTHPLLTLLDDSARSGRPCKISRSAVRLKGAMKLAIKRLAWADEAIAPKFILASKNALL